MLFVTSQACWHVDFSARSFRSAVSQTLAYVDSEAAGGSCVCVVFYGRRERQHGNADSPACEVCRAVAC